MLALATSLFSLSWTHSVEKIVWEEHWAIEDNRLVLVEARVAGSGAGILPPPDAVRTEDGWSWRPSIAPLEHLSLAASGAAPSAWRLCSEQACRDLGAEEGETISLWAAEICSAP